MRLAEFFGYAKEREAIRLRKESGQPWPWTEDEILQGYKFTNILREHDATSKNLIDIRYSKLGPFAPSADVMINCALSRYFGTTEMAEAIGIISYDNWDNERERIRAVAKDRRAAGLKTFTGAYIITNGGISAPKEDVVLDIYLQALHDNMPDILAAVITGSWETTTEALKKVQGFGGAGFMAKETLVDTTYTSMWGQEVNDPRRPAIRSVPYDWDTWSPVGPGARRGVARLLGFDDVYCPEAKAIAKNVHFCQDKMSVIRDSQKQYWGSGHLAQHDIQFTLCEFDKYERVRLGQGRPRSKYRRPK